MIYDFRKDPSTGRTNETDIVNETHAVVQVPELPNRFGFILNEAPVDRAQIGNYVTAQIYRNGAWADMTETALTNTALKAGQFSINYGDNVGDESTGKNYRIGQLFTSSSNAGLPMRVSYKGLGSLMHRETMRQTLAYYSAYAEGGLDLPISGSLFAPAKGTDPARYTVYDAYQSAKWAAAEPIGTAEQLSFYTDRALKVTVSSTLYDPSGSGYEFKFSYGSVAKYNKTLSGVMPVITYSSVFIQSPPLSGMVTVPCSLVLTSDGITISTIEYIIEEL